MKLNEEQLTAIIFQIDSLYHLMGAFLPDSKEKDEFFIAMMKIFDNLHNERTKLIIERSDADV